MALEVSPVHRNLYTRVTFLSLEFEDLFAVLGLAAVMNIVSRLASGALAATLAYGVPLAVVPLLLILKYGKPRGYLRDLALWHLKPRAYSGAGRDRQLSIPYIIDEEPLCH